MALFWRPRYVFSPASSHFLALLFFNIDIVYKFVAINRSIFYFGYNLNFEYFVLYFNFINYEYYIICMKTSYNNS